MTSAGPAWGLRVGVEVLPWLAFEARYAGMDNSVSSSVGGGAFLASAATAVVRVEAAYHFQISESYSNVTVNKIDGGDLTTFAAVLRARL